MQAQGLKINNDYYTIDSSLVVNGDIELSGGNLIVNNHLITDGITLSQTNLSSTNLATTNLITTNLTTNYLAVTGNKINTLRIPVTDIKDDEEIVHTGKSYITYGSGYVDSIFGLSNALLLLNSTTFQNMTSKKLNESMILSSMIVGSQLGIS